jgi:hypothetical protein
MDFTPKMTDEVVRRNKMRSAAEGASAADQIKMLEEMIRELHKDC